jgi:hypothetical protein
MTHVYVLQHVHAALNGEEDVKLIWEPSTGPICGCRVPLPPRAVGAHWHTSNGPARSLQVLT